jgi:uncharacterized protein
MLNNAYHPTRNYLRQQEDVIVAYLFGSAAREQMTPMSDIDIALLLDTPTNGKTMLERQLGLLTDLDQLVEQEIQITLLNHAPPLLAYQVLQEGILLHERSTAERVAFQVKALREYFDIQPILKRNNQALRAQIKESGLGRQNSGDLRTIEAAERIYRRLTATSTS